MNYLKQDFYQLMKADESVFNFVQDLSLEGLLYLDLEHPGHLWMNPKFKRTLGYQHPEMLHESATSIPLINKDENILLENLMLSEDLHDFIEHLSIPDEGKDYSSGHIVRYLHKNGLIVWINSFGKIIKDPEGKSIRLLVALEDVTSDRSTELLLQNSNRLARIGTWEIDLVNNKPFWSTVTKEIHEVPEDYKPDLSTALNFFKEGESRKKITAAVDKALNEGTVFDIELQIITAANHERWVRSIGLTEVKDGRCLRIYGTFQDITTKKQAEFILSRSNQLNRIFIEQSPNAIAMFDTKMRYMAASLKWVQDYGLEGKEIIGISHYEVFPEVPDEWKIDHQNCLKGAISKCEEILFERNDGSKQWITWDVRPWYIGEGEIGGLLMYTADITKRKLTEQRLHQTLTDLEGLSRATYQVSIISADINGAITFVNKGAENLLGYSAEELLSKRVGMFHDPQEVALRSAELTEMFGKEINGSNVFEEYSRQGESETREWTYIRKDGSRFPVQLVVTTIKDTLGEIQGFLGIATDISKIKAVENELKIVLDLTNDQNKRLLNFAHIVSHNLRSHSGNLTMLLDFIETDKDEEARKEMFLMFRDAASNLQETIDHLSEVVVMNSQTRENLTPVNLNKAMNGALGNVKALLKAAGGKYRNEISEDMVIAAVPAYLDSILLNFLTNAIKYRSEDRPLLIELSAEAEGDFIKLSIRDNGLGINLKLNGDKMFGMYKTFHRNKDSRGVGLFITKNQIEAMGGSVSVESEVDHGTCFNIIFKKN